MCIRYLRKRGARCLREIARDLHDACISRRRSHSDKDGSLARWVLASGAAGALTNEAAAR